MSDKFGTKDIQQYSFHYGLGILRIWMCFEVVCCHFWGQNNLFYLEIFSKARNNAVPIFMILSFYFLSRSKFVDRNMTYHDILKYGGVRLNRVSYPHIFWALTWWVILMVLGDLRFISYRLNLIDLFWQIISGHKYYPPLWFQADLFYLTVLWLLIIYFGKVKYIDVLLSLGLLILSIYLQYSGLNYEIFFNSKSTICYSFGRIAEVCPYACIGYIWGRLSFDDKLNRLAQRNIIYRITIVTICFVIYMALISIKWNAAKPLGFQYQGVLFIFESIFLFACFDNISNDWVPYRLRKIIYMTSKLTLGIYCLHLYVGRLGSFIFELLCIPYESFGYSGFVFLLSLFISCCLYIIPVTGIKRAVC